MRKRCVLPGSRERVLTTQGSNAPGAGGSGNCRSMQELRESARVHGSQLGKRYGQRVAYLQRVAVDKAEPHEGHALAQALERLRRTRDHEASRPLAEQPPEGITLRPHLFARGGRLRSR